MKLPITILTLLSFVTTQAQSDENTKLLPSEALTLMYAAVDANPDGKRIDATKRYQSRVITIGLSDEEQFYLGETYFWNFMPIEAKAAYTPFLTRDDKFGRVAWQRVMQINFAGFKMYDEVEEQLTLFYKRFKVEPDDRSFMVEAVMNLGRKYQGEGNHEKVLQLIDNEYSHLNFEGPYISYILPAIFIESYKALQKTDKAISMLEKAKDGLQETLDNREKEIPEKDNRYAQNYKIEEMLTAVTEKLGYAQRNEKFERLIESIDNHIKKLKEQ